MSESRAERHERTPSIRLVPARSNAMLRSMGINVDAGRLVVTSDGVVVDFPDVEFDRFDIVIEEVSVPPGSLLRVPPPPEYYVVAVGRLRPSDDGTRFSWRVNE